jgi:hypothetical protein
MSYEIRSHVVDTLYAAMTTLDPCFLASLRDITVTADERRAAEDMVLAALGHGGNSGIGYW